MAANLDTHRVEKLTAQPTDVVSFAVGKRGAILFAARAPRDTVRSAKLLRDGFVFPDANGLAMLRGDVDGFSGLDSRTFLSSGPGAPARPVRANRRGLDLWTPVLPAVFSPDGRRVVVEATPDEIPGDWGRYTDDILHTSVEEAKKTREGFYARFLKVEQVVDVATGKSRALWMVPNSSRLKMAWSPDGRALVLGATYLPADSADADGLAGRATAVVDAATGAVERLAVPAEVAERGIAHVAWPAPDRVEADDGRTRLVFERRGDAWTLSSSEPLPGDAASPAAVVRLEIRQDANTPPRLFALEPATGRSRLVLDPNPDLTKRFTLGRVEGYTWKDRAGRDWSGLLYHPVHETPGRRYPLVIQTHGHAPETAFSLYGPGPATLVLGLGPSHSVFAAQPLANRDIAVLHIEDKDDVAGAFVTPKEPALHMEAYETAVEALAKSGLVDPKKVGVVGYSRTGWHVEYALTHSSFPFAAAITTDNLDGSYTQSVLLWGDELAKDAGAPPFGDGLKTWLENSPGFNADRVHTPLRLQIESGGFRNAMAKWEMFSRLTQLKRPVEFAVLPEIGRGSHGVQNPRQCLFAQQGAVDWFDFWLNGREDSDPGKAEQYARWRHLRELRLADVGNGEGGER
jgi:dipeptidyl aminopeptidase/acylaminoacyl peptidase